MTLVKTMVNWLNLDQLRPLNKVKLLGGEDVDKDATLGRLALFKYFFFTFQCNCDATIKQKHNIQ